MKWPRRQNRGQADGREEVEHWKQPIDYAKEVEELSRITRVGFAVAAGLWIPRKNSRTHRHR